MSRVRLAVPHLRCVDQRPWLVLASRRWNVQRLACRLAVLRGAATGVEEHISPYFNSLPLSYQDFHPLHSSVFACIYTLSNR